MYVCFTEAKGPYSGIFNRLIGFITGGKYCHVTVVFELFTEDGIVFQECSIVKCNDQTLSRVHFSRVEDMTGWKCYHMRDVDARTEIETYEYARDNLISVPYDTSKMFLEYIPFIRYSSGYTPMSPDGGTRVIDKKTYCSKMTLEILQRAGLFIREGYDGMSPNRLERLIAAETPERWTDVSDRFESIVRPPERLYQIINQRGQKINL